MSEMGTLHQLPPRDLGPAQHFGTLQSERSWTNNHPRCAAMRRFLPILLVLALQVLASETSLAQAQTLTSNDGSSEEVPRDSVPQNTPCVGQPKSRRELAASFQQGRLPEASEITGTWVAIGTVWSEYRSLNCSGENRGSKFEFVMVANGYSAELHPIGTYLQKVTMRPDHKGSVEFPVDFEADEGPDTYRGRLTKRGTLACLDGALSGVEFKKMRVEKGRIYEGAEVP